MTTNKDKPTKLELADKYLSDGLDDILLEIDTAISRWTKPISRINRALNKKTNILFEKISSDKKEISIKNDLYTISQTADKDTIINDVYGNKIIVSENNIIINNQKRTITEVLKECLKELPKKNIQDFFSSPKEKKDIEPRNKHAFIKPDEYNKQMEVYVFPYGNIRSTDTKFFRHYHKSIKPIQAGSKGSVKEIYDSDIDISFHSEKKTYNLSKDEVFVIDPKFVLKKDDYVTIYPGVCRNPQTPIKSIIPTNTVDVGTKGIVTERDWNIYTVKTGYVYIKCHISELELNNTNKGNVAYESLESIITVNTSVTKLLNEVQKGVKGFDEVIKKMQ